MTDEEIRIHNAMTQEEYTRQFRKIGAAIAELVEGLDIGAVVSALAFSLSATQAAADPEDREELAKMARRMTKLGAEAAADKWPVAATVH